MSSNKNEKVDLPQQEEDQVEAQDKDQEQEPEEEPVDIELQKQMQKVTIDDSVFDQQQSKQKGKNKKKATKKKGQDFLDYASKNNIQINLQYGDEEKHYASHHYKEKANDYSGQNQPQTDSQYQKQPQQYQQNQHDQPQGQQQQGMNQNQKGKYKGNNKYKTNYHKTNQQQGRKGPIKFGENKFDACNNNMMNYQYGMPNQPPYQQFPYNQPNPQQYNQPLYPQQSKEITLTTDDQILGYIERLLSLNTLNKDLYLRFRITDKGMININDLGNYYGLKNNNVTPQKIIDVISKNDTVASVGVVEENNVIYIAIRHWNTMLPQLQSIEVISEKKKQFKQQQQQGQMNMMPNQYTPYTYIHMQNNYYIPNQGESNEIQGSENGNYTMPSQQQDINHP